MDYPDVVAGVSPSDDLFELIDLLGRRPFVAGVQPYARTRSLSRVRRDAALLPDGTVPALQVVADSRRAHLAFGDGWTLRVQRYAGDTAYVAVVATTDALAASVVEQTVFAACNQEPPPSVAVSFRFWHSSRGSPTSRVRDIAIRAWADIQCNYTRAAAAAIDELSLIGPADVTGRVVLLYGPPGTGKTTAIRSLAHAWKHWCGFEVVLDPDRFFGDPSYLLAAAVDGDDDEDEKRWRCFVLEDCDELLAGDGKQAQGQALSRLLNLSDGIFGEGGRTLLLITTNEAIATLHPAITRPGRCLARIEIGALDAAEARAWLGEALPRGRTSATLAELYALRSGTGVVATPDHEVGGLYL
jgi:energy-coupling factor transporter ATP-binding protein EcfA2